jgi:hypothetical protein
VQEFEHRTDRHEKVTYWLGTSAAAADVVAAGIIVALVQD